MPISGMPFAIALIHCSAIVACNRTSNGNANDNRVESCGLVGKVTVNDEGRHRFVKAKALRLHSQYNKHNLAWSS